MAADNSQCWCCSDELGCSSYLTMNIGDQMQAKIVCISTKLQGLQPRCPYGRDVTEL